LANAIADMVNRVANASRVHFALDLDDVSGALSRNVEINLYRIAQEAVNNLVKHADATEASVTLERTDTAVRLIVTDNGRGFDAHPTGRLAGTLGFGLTGIGERVRLLGGVWAVHSAPGTGTRVEVTVALEREP